MHGSGRRPVGSTGSSLRLRYETSLATSMQFASAG